MSEQLLQAARLRAAASERACFIPVPKPEYYSLRQGEEESERASEGGSGWREGGGREEGAGSGEGARREKLGKRRRTRSGRGWGGGGPASGRPARSPAVAAA